MDNNKIELKLNNILIKLNQIEKRLENIENDTKSISKHIPFVDSLANSGAVSAVSSLNTLFKSINPYNLLKYDDTELIENNS